MEDIYAIAKEPTLYPLEEVTDTQSLVSLSLRQLAFLIISRSIRIARLFPKPRAASPSRALSLEQWHNSCFDTSL